VIRGASFAAQTDLVDQQEVCHYKRDRVCSANRLPGLARRIPLLFGVAAVPHRRYVINFSLIPAESKPT
jgi:hypothetical protein